jgi:hypothetical protein
VAAPIIKTMWSEPAYRFHCHLHTQLAQHIKARTHAPHFQCSANGSLLGHAGIYLCGCPSPTGSTHLQQLGLAQIYNCIAARS